VKKHDLGAAGSVAVMTSKRQPRSVRPSAIVVQRKAPVAPW